MEMVTKLGALLLPTPVRRGVGAVDFLDVGFDGVRTITECDNGNKLAATGELSPLPGPMLAANRAGEPKPLKDRLS